MSARQARAGAIRYVIIVACGLVTAGPILYVFARSFMSPAEIYAFPPRLLPSELFFENYVTALQYLNGQVILNTFVFALGVVGLQLVLSLPAAFALAKIPFRWTAAVLAVLVVPLFIPANFTLVPMFLVTYQLGWLNTWAGLIVPMAAQISFAVLLFRQFFVGLPPGLIEAARIDGASWLRTFWSIALPLSKPILATYCSVSFLTAWNMFVWPLVVATNPAYKVINVALAPLAGGAYSQVSPAVGLAAAVISMIPVLIVFVAMQRWYVKGIVGTGLE